MEFRKDGNTLTITIPLGSGVPSKSGKSLMVATTNGFQQIEGTDLRVSINIIKPRPQRQS